MLLDNYYKLIAMSFGKSITRGGSPIDFTTLTGATVSMRKHGSHTSSYYDTLGLAFGETIAGNLTSSYGTAFGTGTTPPTLSDYTLSGDLITGLSVTTARSVKEDESGVTCSLLHTVVNNNSDEVTIGEVSYIAQVTGFNGTSSNITNCYCLIERAVLDEPVTIPAGGVGQVTYTIRIIYPT